MTISSGDMMLPQKDFKFATITKDDVKLILRALRDYAGQFRTGDVKFSDLMPSDAYSAEVNDVIGEILSVMHLKKKLEGAKVFCVEA